jgi:hypothetical protein
MWSPGPSTVTTRVSIGHLRGSGPVSRPTSIIPLDRTRAEEMTALSHPCDQGSSGRWATPQASRMRVALDRRALGDHAQPATLPAFSIHARICASTTSSQDLTLT